MIGYYNILEDGIIVAQSPNVITTAGGRVILGFLAGQMPNMAGAIAIGSAAAAATVNDIRLGFEIGRAATILSTPDYVNKRVIWKATLPTGIAGTIYELGLYPSLTGPMTGGSSRLITAFDSTAEGITGGTVSTAAADLRTGQASTTVTAATGATTSITVDSVQGDLSGYGGVDTFALAYFTNDAFASSVVVRFRTTSSSYFQYTITPPTTSTYNVTNFLKSAMTSVGTPDWTNIADIQVSVTGTGGTTNIDLDGLRVNDNDTYTDYALVSHSILGTPYTKAYNQEVDIEYVLGFTF